MKNKKSGARSSQKKTQTENQKQVSDMVELDPDSPKFRTPLSEPKTGFQRGGPDHRGRIAAHRSEFRGIYWESHCKSWSAKVVLPKPIGRLHLGQFASDEIAAERLEEFLHKVMSACKRKMNMVEFTEEVEKREIGGERLSMDSVIDLGIRDNLENDNG